MKTALIKLHIAVLLAGFTAILGHLISLKEAPLVWWRLIFTVVAMWAWMFFKKDRIGYATKTRLEVLGIGIFIGLHWLCFFGSIKYANVSVAVVCLSASGFFAALLEPLVTPNKLQWSELGLGLLSMAGIYIIFHFDAQFKTGVLLGVACALFSAVFAVFNKNIIHKIDNVSLTAYEMLGALLTITALVPLYWYHDHVSLMPIGWDWLWLLVLSLICTVWAFVLQLDSLKYISAFTLNLSYNLEPVYGIMLAFILFKENEQLSWRFYIGVLLIVLSVVLQMRRVYKRKKRLA